LRLAERLFGLVFGLLGGGDFLRAGFDHGAGLLEGGFDFMSMSMSGSYLYIDDDFKIVPTSTDGSGVIVSVCERFHLLFLRITTPCSHTISFSFPMLPLRQMTPP
jgi:hypothetical protein